MWKAGGLRAVWFSLIAAERPVAEAREVESVHVAQELDETFDAARGAGLALGGGRLGGVAGGAEFVEVVGHPADGDRLGHAKPLEILLDRDRRTDEIARFAHAHRIGLESQHQRRLGVAAVNAVGALGR